VNEAANENEEEFGEDRLQEMISNATGATPDELCERIMGRVAAFASAGPPPDDRTLMVVRFQRVGGGLSRRARRAPGIEAVEAPNALALK
jgi:hypothetical protein